MLPLRFTLTVNTMALSLLSNPFPIYHKKLSSQLTLRYLHVVKIRINQCVNLILYSASLVKMAKGSLYVLFTLTHKYYLIKSMMQLYIP